MPVRQKKLLTNWAGAMHKGGGGSEAGRDKKRKTAGIRMP